MWKVTRRYLKGKINRLHSARSRKDVCTRIFELKGSENPLPSKTESPKTFNKKYVTDSEEKKGLR